MKYLLILTTILLTQTVNASETEVPAGLKGAKITVRLADGTETTMPAEQFKVVPRKPHIPTAVVPRPEKPTEKCPVVEAPTPAPVRRNRLSLLGGYGSKGGLASSVSSYTTTVEEKLGLVVGAQYQRLLPALDDRLSVGLQLQTNNTASVLLGIDF